MKLYATTTSERASKGQGGNKYLQYKLLIGDKYQPKEVLEITAKVVGEEITVLCFNPLLNRVMFLDRYPLKGEQKKDEKCPKCGSKYIIAYYGHCNSCKHDW